MYEDFDSSYEELLNKAKIPTLHVRRLRTMALETFKILNNMSLPVLSNLVRLRENDVYNFGYNNILEVPRVRHQNLVKRVLDMQQRSHGTVFQMSSEKWVHCNFNQLKALISNWNGGDCKCNLCR